jgi:tetratricopeptide (TPR) repeat protein
MTFLPRHPAAWLLSAALLAVPPGVAAADEAGTATDNPGQAALTAAIEAKLDADDLDDFRTVLEGCREAIAKGLDEGSRKFAEDLYTSTLVDRAATLCNAIFEAARPSPQWRRIRGLAMKDLEEVVGRDPGVGNAHLLIARLQALPDGDREQAAASARKAIDLLADDPLRCAQATLVLAELEDDADRRAARFDEAVEFAPRDADVRRARGMARLAADQFDAAREDLAVAAEEDAEDASLQEALGMACLMADRLDEARTAFDRAIEIDPDSPGPLLQRARVFALGGDSDRALADVDRVLELVPNEPMALVLRARIHQQAGDADAALADLKDVLDDNPDMAAALELRGLIAAEQEDYALAIRDFRRLVGRNPDDPVLLGQLGMFFLAAKQPAEAIKRFTLALEIDEEDFPSRRGRGDAALSIGDHAAALKDLEKAVAIKPDDPGALNNLAWLLATSPDDGIRDGRRAVELALKACEATDWKQSHIISTLAAGHAEAGDFDAARKFSRQAVEAGHDEPAVREQLESELASYEAGQPWRERQSVEESREPPSVRPADRGAAEATLQPRRPFEDD